MRYRKFFFDLVYYRGDLVARHPDFFIVYDEYNYRPRSMEALVERGKDFLVTDKHVYMKKDKVLFKMDVGGSFEAVDSFVEGGVWDVLKSKGKVYFVEVDEGFSSVTVYYILGGRYVYPVRVMGQLVTIFLPNGYVSTDLDSFEMIYSFDDAAKKLKKIYNHSYVDDSGVGQLLEDGRWVKGLKFIIFPGSLQLWRGAYTINVRPGGSVMVDPVMCGVPNPIEMVLSPYLVAFML